MRKLSHRTSLIHFLTTACNGSRFYLDLLISHFDGSEKKSLQKRNSMKTIANLIDLCVHTERWKEIATSFFFSLWTSISLHYKPLNKQFRVELNATWVLLLRTWLLRQERPWGVESNKRLRRKLFGKAQRRTWDCSSISKTFINCHANVFSSLSLLLLIYMNMDCKNCATSLVQAEKFIIHVKIRKLSVKASALTDDKLRSLQWPKRRVH